MNIAISNQGKNYVIQTEGRLDTTNAFEFENKVGHLLSLEGINLTLDIAGLTFISSSGLRCFITLLKGVKGNSGQMVIVNMRPEIKEVFDMIGFTNIFDIK
ncbi:MAG: STAS domain-containing protein [Bacteroidales bacterium]